MMPLKLAKLFMATKNNGIDSYIKKVVKETDQMVKDFESEDEVKDDQQRHFRGYVTAQVALFVVALISKRTYVHTV